MNRNSEETVNWVMPGSGAVPPIRPETGSEHVAILLALRNGSATIAEQLNSFGNQSHPDWSLIVSDDGSSDSGPDLVGSFSASRPNKVTLVDGPERGYAQNFLSLLKRAGPIVPFAALSDQDDVWMPKKLERALDRLAAFPEAQPALYAGRTLICDASLRPMRRSPAFERPPSFRNALVQSIGGGNTMVLNRAALDLMQETAHHARGIVSHDWWIYQLVTGAGGSVVYDSEPTVFLPAA